MNLMPRYIPHLEPTPELPLNLNKTVGEYQADFEKGWVEKNKNPFLKQTKRWRNFLDIFLTEWFV